MKQTEELKKYRGMDYAALEKELFELEKKLTGTTLKVKAGKHDDYSLIPKLKKNIARVNSIIFEKSLEK